MEHFIFFVFRIHFIYFERYPFMTRKFGIKYKHWKMIRMLILLQKVSKNQSIETMISGIKKDFENFPSISFARV